MILKLYPNILYNDRIKAYKYGNYAKVDIVIEVNDIKKGISVKSGSRNSVHVENVNSFCNFLIQNNFKHLKDLKEYLYSDGSFDNSGKLRMSCSEYKEKNSFKISQINHEFNNKELISLCIDRFLVKADVNYGVTTSMILYGTPCDFMFVLIEDLKKYFLTVNLESSGVHVISFFIQLWNKNLNYNPKYEYCRNYVQVKWYSLFDDLMKIYNENNYIL